jgi:hypothetical protein
VRVELKRDDDASVLSAGTRVRGIDDALRAAVRATAAAAAGFVPSHKVDVELEQQRQRRGVVRVRELGVAVGARPEPQADRDAGRGAGRRSFRKWRAGVLDV